MDESEGDAMEKCFFCGVNVPAAGRHYCRPLESTAPRRISARQTMADSEQSKQSMESETTAYEKDNTK